MDHEVQDDIDIQGTGGEDAETMGLKEQRAVEQREYGADCRVEALQMADLEDAAPVAGQLDEGIGLFQ